jgi:hypothetical protein
MPARPSNPFALRAAPALALTLSLGVAPAARGDDIPGDFEDVRPLGMGDAFTAVANDEASVWYNPAGIGRSRKARSRSTFNVTSVPNLIVGANAESTDFYQAFKGAADKNVEGVLTNANNLGDKPFYARGALFPVTLFDLERNAPMALGFVSNTTVTAIVPKDTPDTARVSAISDTGAVATLGYASDSNRFNLAIQGRPIERYSYEDSIPSDQLVNKKEMARHLREDSNKMQGLGVDFGMLYTVADFWFPTVGFSVMNLPTGCKQGYLNPYTEKLENVCGDVFKGNIANSDALSVVDPTDIRAGVAITPRLGRNLSVRFSLDAHHIPVGTAAQSYGLQGIEPSKLVHAGAELFFGNPLKLSSFSLRAGYNQGFAAYGFSLNLGAVDLEFASYGADVSTTVTPVEDRRYLASLSVSI